MRVIKMVVALWENSFECKCSPHMIKNFVDAWYIYQEYNEKEWEETLSANLGRRIEASDNFITRIEVITEDQFYFETGVSLNPLYGDKNPKVEETLRDGGSIWKYPNDKEIHF